MISLQRALFAAALVIALCLGMFTTPREVRAAPSGAGWTVIIVAGSIVIYEFGYRLPIDNAKLKGAWAEAEEVTKTRYDTTTTGLFATAMDEKTFNTLTPAATVTVVYKTGTKTPCTLQRVPNKSEVIPAGACGTFDGDTVRIPYVAGGQFTFDDIRAQAIQTLVGVPKDPKNGKWRKQYTALQSCWNKLIFVDPQPSVAPSAESSGSATPKPTPTPTKTPKPSTKKPTPKPSKNPPAHPKHTPNPRPANDDPPPTAKPTPTPKPATATPSPTPPPIGAQECAYDLAGKDDAAPAIVSDKVPAAYVDLIEATNAFNNAPSLRQQIFNRRVGTYLIDNLSRGAVLARLAGIFNLNNPLVGVKKITYYSTLVPYHAAPGQTPAPTATAVSLQTIYTGFKSCVSSFSATDCFSNVEAMEQTIISGIAAQNACAFATGHWLPPINAVGVRYGKEMAASAKATDDNTQPSLPSIKEIQSTRFVGVPQC